MKWFWPCFFAFLLGVLALVAVVRADMFQAALVAVGIYLAIVASLLALFGVLIGAVILYGKWTKYQLAKRRQQDGAWPAEYIRLRAGGTMRVDPNRIISAAAILHPDHGLIELEPQAGYAMQLQYNLAVEATRRVQAAFKGDDAHRDGHGSASDNPRLTAAAKPLFQPDLAPPPALPAPVAAAPPAPPLTLKDAFRQAAADRLILGQADDGALAIYNPRLHASAAIVGNTGTGKTSSVGFTLAGQAIRAGYHVVILDPDGGQDWAPFAGHAEYSETDPATFPAQVSRLHAEFEERAQIDQPQPMIVIVEEFGDLSRSLRIADAGAATEVDARLNTMMSRGRKRSMAFVLIDQYPERWSKQVLSAVKFRAVFQLGPNQGAVMEEWKAGQLPPRGVFLVSGKQYRSWDARPHLRPMLATLPAAPAGILDTVRGDRSQPRSQPVRPEVDPPPPPFVNGDGAPVDAAQIQTPDPGADAGKWDELTAQFFAAHPDLLTGAPRGISDLARAMCRAESGIEANYEAYKSVAHAYYHQFRAAVRLPSGQRLGVDVSQPGQ